ncbi:hypothetical protein RhiirA1_401057 [Rhizophagus irregularis]|uniref:Uncharacterized protein n=1 Tax=Rhizophagus irregularis TaxID=588596 RepID=A0A2N0R3J1_9GLOM|nr:hypothetical protein RhiirA1_401057 [Rhizophagus irregularis]
MATLWADHKPTAFLTTCDASAFKIIQTSKGKRKLVGYFENWEATLKALNTSQVFFTNGKNTSNKKSGVTGQSKDSNKPKKKDIKSLTRVAKDDNQLKNPSRQRNPQRVKVVIKPLALKGLTPVDFFNYTQCIWVRLGSVVSLRSWDNFAFHFYYNFGDMDDVVYDENVTDDGLDKSSEDDLDEDEDDIILGLQIPNPVVEMPPILPDDKQKSKARVTDDKQVKNQSTTAKPNAQTLAKNSQKEKKSSKPKAIQILTRYETVREEQKQI